MITFGGLSATLSDPEFTNDEVYRILSSYNPREIIILSDKNYGDVKTSYLTKHLNLSRTLTHFKWDTYEYLSNMSNIGYQIAILEKSFEKKNMLSIIEALNLEKYEYGRLSLCCLIQFAYEHNVDIIKAPVSYTKVHPVDKSIPEIPTTGRLSINS